MKRTRTNMYDAAAMVVHLGKATLSDLEAWLPSLSRYQIQKALHNASRRGLVHCHRHGQDSYWIPGPVPVPAPTEPPKKREVYAVASVFDLGGVLLREAAGTVHSPLGEW